MEGLFQSALCVLWRKNKRQQLRTPNFANGNLPEVGIWAGLGHPVVDVEVRDGSGLQPVLEGTQVTFKVPSSPGHSVISLRGFCSK